MGKPIVCGKVKEETHLRFLTQINELVPGVAAGSKTNDGLRRIVASQGYELQIKSYIDQWNQDPNPFHVDPEQVGIITWTYAITTVPSRMDYFKETLESLKNAGFDNPLVFVDAEASDKYDWFDGTVVFRGSNIRTYGHWLLTMVELYIRQPYATRYAIFQDDFRILKNTRSYLDSCLYPEKGYLNLLTMHPKREGEGNEKQALERDRVGWVESNQLGHGAVALVFSNDAVVTLLSQTHMYRRMWNEKTRHRNVDGGVVHSMKEAGWKEYIHIPGLVEHQGEQSSMGNGFYSTKGIVFPEDFDASFFISQPGEPMGLGDMVEYALTKFGITKDRVENWLGAPCGCTERVQKLNDLGKWAKNTLTGLWGNATERLESVLRTGTHEKP